MLWTSVFSAQDQQGGPGLDRDMKEQAVWTQMEYWGDDGKPYLKEYEGRDLLKGKSVLITGGDSGIGRSVAIIMAREGADVAIVYLPEEEPDAKWTISMIEKAGQGHHRSDSTSGKTRVSWAERDILANAEATWLVKMHTSFQETTALQAC